MPVHHIVRQGLPLGIDAEGQAGFIFVQPVRLELGVLPLHAPDGVLHKAVIIVQRRRFAPGGAGNLEGDLVFLGRPAQGGLGDDDIAAVRLPDDGRGIS